MVEEQSLYCCQTVAVDASRLLKLLETSLRAGTHCRTDSDYNVVAGRLLELSSGSLPAVVHLPPLPYSLRLIILNDRCYSNLLYVLLDWLNNHRGNLYRLLQAPTADSA